MLGEEVTCRTVAMSRFKMSKSPEEVMTALFVSQVALVVNLKGLCCAFWAFAERKRC